MIKVKTFVLLIDGKYVKGFDGPPIGKSGVTDEWYVHPGDALGTIEYTDDVNEAYEVDSSRFNVKSLFDRIINRMSEQGLEFSSFELIKKTRD